MTGANNFSFQKSSLHGICEPICGGLRFMTMFEFELLPWEEQINMLYKHSVYIGKKKGKRFTRLLFQLESFYVEVIYSSYRRVIHEMYYSDSTDILDAYLGQIEVEQLIE